MFAFGGKADMAFCTVKTQIPTVWLIASSSGAFGVVFFNG
jgi:hypothetical protein